MVGKPPESILPGKPITTHSFERNLISVASGGGITLAGKMFTNLSRLVTAVLLARLLGAEQYGMYQLALNAGTLVAGFALLGMDTALVRFVAISAGRRDKASLLGTLEIGIGIPALVSVLTGVGLFALAYPVADQIFHDPRLTPLLQLVSLSVPFLTLSDALVGAVRGFKNMEYPVIAQFIAQPLVRMILIGIVALIGLTVSQAIVIFAIGELVATAMLLYYLHKLFPLSPLFPARRDFRAIMGYAVPDWLAGMLDRFGGNIQALLIGSLDTLAGVGIFAVAAQINVIGHDFYSSVNIAARPFIAELHDRGEREQLERMYQAATKWSLLVNLPLFLTLIVFPIPILSIFGQSFEGGATALIVLAWGNLVDVSTGMCGTLLNMTGYTKLKLINNTIIIALDLVLNILLIPIWGIVGAAAAVLIAQGVVNILRMIQVYVLLHLRPYNLSFLKPVIAGCVAFASTLALRNLLPEETNLLYVIPQILALFAVFAGAVLAMGLSAEDRLLLGRLRKKILNFLPEK